MNHFLKQNNIDYSEHKLCYLMQNAAKCSGSNSISMEQVQFQRMNRRMYVSMVKSNNLNSIVLVKCVSMCFYGSCYK